MTSRCPRRDCARSEACAAPFADGTSVCQPTAALPGSLSGPPGTMPDLRTPEVDFHQMLGDDDSQGWAIQRQLNDQLGRPYLATQLASMLPHEVAMRLVQRIEELTGPELEKRLGEHVADLQADVDRVTAETLVRLAAAADEKRRDLTRERFGRRSRLD